MKLSILVVWLAFMLCGNCLPKMAMAVRDTSTSHLEGFNLSKASLMQLEGHAQGLNGTITLEEESDELEHKERQDIFHSMKPGRRGKGGGANIGHRPRPQKNPASLSARPCFVSIAFLLYVSLALVLTFPVSSVL